MRRIFVFFAVVTLCVSALAGLLMTTSGGSHRAKVGYPNFACVAAWNLVGFCIGPPTKTG